MAEPEVNTLRPLGVSTGVGASSIDNRINSIPDPFSDQQYAQERLDNAREGRSNPPFALTSSYNRLAEGQGSIVRGYIRRSDIDPGDPTSKYRLYFMYNPETIQRNYMAYLDQQSLDPYNTLFGSSNAPAPPGILDFSFELLFDRHLEVAKDSENEGIKVDYRFFDIVVRGVVPDVPSGGNAIPDDNGIIMLNPKNVAVVFGPELIVHGRPYNASVRFEKFNHRMVPTRMTVNITMKVFYIGPVQTVPDFETTPSTAIFAATIPYNQVYDLSYQTIGVDVSDIETGTSTSSSTNSNISSPVINTNITGPKFHQAGVALTESEMTDLVIEAGLSGEPAAIAIAIAYKESFSRGFFQAGAHNPVFPDDSWGLFQFNFRPGANTVVSLGATPQQCTIPAVAMTKFIEKSSNVTQFRPWAIMPNGNYGRFENNVLIDTGKPMDFLPQARNLLRSKGKY